MSKSASQEFVPLKDVRDGVAILKNGQINAYLLTSSLNFSLKSVDEQAAILASFQSFLNTLDFSIQFYMQSRRLDIEPYLEMLLTREASQYSDLMRVQLREYIEFVRTFTAEADIMSKNFFVVVPFTPSSLDVGGMRGLLGKKSKKEAFDAARFNENKVQLEQRVAVVEQGMARMGIKTIPLGTDEIVELFYHIFNPEDTAKAPAR